MHLFSFENEEDKDTGINKFDSLFCPMSRLTTIMYAEKWKSIPKGSETKVIVGKMFTNKEPSVIKRLQAHNIVVCSYKTVEKTTYLYLSCTTRDNIIILAELTLVSNDYLYGKLKYKSENKGREVDFENYLTMILSNAEASSEEEVISR